MRNNKNLGTVYKDFKNRLYILVEVNKRGTVLECDKTGDRVTIRNNNWYEMGFIAN